MKTQVGIIGGGPCGLLTGLLLARLGVNCILLEKHPDISFHPKATLVNRRSNEIFRQLDLVEQIEAANVMNDIDGLSVWSRGLGGELLGMTSLSVDPPGLTPCRRVHCPQPYTEAVLRQALEAEPLAEVHYHTRMTDFRDTGAGVELSIADLSSGQESKISADWMVAADGAESPVRSALGIDTNGPGDMGHFLNVYFRAPLGAHLEGRRAILYQSVGDDFFGFFVAVNGDDLWLMHYFLQEGESPEDFSQGQLRAMVQKIADLPDLSVEVISVSPWVMSPKIAAQWRKGRVVLTGDASARLSPSGGLGMNTGLASAHNLAWKLAAVAHGQAGEALLDSYEAERLPAAGTSCDTSIGNAEEIHHIVEAAMTGQWDRAKDLIAHSRRAGSGLGLDLGLAYQSSAILADGGVAPAPADVVNDYTPAASPGHRAPHLEVTVNGQPVTTLDFFGDGFCLLCGETGKVWQESVEVAAQHIGPGLPLKCHVEGMDFISKGGDFCTCYGIEPSGAVLIRPDGYVGARWQTHEGADLTQALREILSKP